MNTFHQIVRGALIAALVAVAVFVALGYIEPAEAWPIVGISLLAGLLIVLPSDKDFWRNLVSGVESLTIGPAAIAWKEKTLRAAEKDSGEGDGATPQSATDLRLKLEAKLAYIAKDMLPPYDNPSGAMYATIGSLREDKLLPDDEAEIADGVMTLRDDELDTLPDEDRDALLDAADTMVGRVRATVLHYLTRKELKGMPDAEFVIVEGEPRDLLQVTVGERTFTVLTVFSENGSILGPPMGRLRKSVEDHPVGGQAVLVLPDTANDGLIGNKDGVIITKLGGLPDVLRAPA